MTGPSTAGPPVQPDEPPARGPRHAAARHLLRPPAPKTPPTTQPEIQPEPIETSPEPPTDLPSYHPDSYRSLPYQPPPRYQPPQPQGPLYEHGPAERTAYGSRLERQAGSHRMPVRPPQPPMDRWFSSEQAMGLSASVLIGVVTVISWATAWSDWNSYQVFKKYAESATQDPEKLDKADLISGSLGIVAALALFAAAAVFIIWLWRVRWNAEMFCRGEHRFTRGWVLGSWICPVVNLWYPKWVVDDIVAASDPRTPPQTVNLRGIPGTRLVWAWWLTWVVGLVLDNVAQRSVLDGAAQLGELRGNAVMSAISAVSTTAAAVLAILLIQRVNDLQMQRPWTPWWAADQAQPPFHGPFRPPAR